MNSAAGLHVVVTGAPASGKSTLARALADELGLPLLAKDSIKQVLLDRLGADDLTASRLLGTTAVDVLLHVAAQLPGAVLDSVWVDPLRARDVLAALPGRLVEVACAAPVAVLRERYRLRAATSRPGHFDLERPDSELWNAVTLTPLGGPWPVVSVDTQDAVDVAGVARRVLTARVAP